MKDIVFPANNEKEFIRIAEKLGYNELVFLYDYNEFLKKQNNKFDGKINIKLGILSGPRNIYNLKNKFKKTL